MIEGISHITFIVKDLEKTSSMFKKVFDAREVYSSDGINHSISNEKFFIIGNTWIAIMEGEPLERSYNHTAFKISIQDFPRYYDIITELGLEIDYGRTRIDGEGKSIYFYDYDNHLFELHTGTLDERLETYSKYINK